MKNKFFWISLVCLGIFVVVCFLYFRNFSGSFSSKQSDWGDFGSYFGGTLGALFASLSFLALLYTIYLQRRELETAISALKKSATAQHEQSKTYEIQRFEVTFYSLLEQHNQVLTELKSQKEEYSSYLCNLFTLDDSQALPKYLEKKQSHILEQSELSQYFRILYQLLKFIAKNNVMNKERHFNECYLGDKTTICLNENEEKMYASIVRSFVPVELLPVLSINCIPSYNGLNNLSLYWELLERYEFLEHMRLDKTPTNLTTFIILNSYAYALGKNDFIQKQYDKLLEKYRAVFENSLTEGCYLHVRFSHP